MNTTDLGQSAPPPPTESLKSVHTSTLPDLFSQLQISLVVSTYQAGKVILIRNDQGVLNTHFRSFAKPMGIAADRSRLTIGGTNTVWYCRNVPAVAPKLEPQDKHDACYLPRRIHVTGDIDIHEMAYDRDDELWVVNTRFGCLGTLDAGHSFHPRWRPPFVSAYAPEDRCHLNGLALVEGRPKYVTALGETDPGPAHGRRYRIALLDALVARPPRDFERHPSPLEPGEHGRRADPVAVFAYPLLEQIINRMLAVDLAAGQSICFLLPRHFLAALFLTFIASLLSAVLGGVRAAHIGPSDGLREVWWLYQERGARGGPAGRRSFLTRKDYPIDEQGMTYLTDTRSGSRARAALDKQGWEPVGAREEGKTLTPRCGKG